MCGRVRLSSDYSEIKIRLKFDNDMPAPNFAASWNLAPTMPIFAATTRAEDGKRIGEMMHWGLVPRFAKVFKMEYATFNARAEDFATKASYRTPWREGKRCLVAVDNYYEWKTLAPKKKQAYGIRLASRQIMILAGLWEVWRDKATGEERKSCTIFTCAPNDKSAEVHNRMPVILEEHDWPRWLGEETATEAELQAMLRPCPDDWIEIYPVSNDVGNVRNNRPDLADEITLEDT